MYQYVLGDKEDFIANTKKTQLPSGVFFVTSRDFDTIDELREWLISNIRLLQRELRSSRSRICLSMDERNNHHISVEYYQKEFHKRNRALAKLNREGPP